MVVSSSELVFPYHFFHAEVGFSGEGRWKTSDRAEDPTFEALNPVLAVWLVEAWLVRGSFVLCYGFRVSLQRVFACCLVWSTPMLLETFYCKRFIRYVQVEIDNRRDVPTHHYFRNPNEFSFLKDSFHIHSTKGKIKCSKDKPQPLQLHIITNFVTQDWRNLKIKDCNQIIWQVLKVWFSFLDRANSNFHKK